jgi:K+-sensing histidine kinase KdpD
MRRLNRFTPLLGSVAAVVFVTAGVFVLRRGIPVLSLGALYVFAVLPVAVLWGRRYAVLVAVASMLTFNFFFLPPEHTFRLAERSNWLALAVYLATALVVSDLASRSRRRAAEAERREREETVLGELSIALLQGENLLGELGRIGEATAAVLEVASARIELGAEAEGNAIELRAGARPVGPTRRRFAASSPPSPPCLRSRSIARSSSARRGWRRGCARATRSRPRFSAL